MKKFKIFARPRAALGLPFAGDRAGLRLFLEELVSGLT
jgi:hypothetical protein